VTLPSALHAEALATLRGWTPPDAGQEALRTRYVAHLEARADGEQRSCFPAHLTAGALVLSADGDRVLLNLHRKAQRWFHFGGHLEPGDATLAAAALREAREESGVLSVDLHPEPVHLDEHVVGFCGPEGDVHHLDVRFAARASAGVRHAASEESLAVRWWPVDALPELEDEMHILIRRARERMLGG
jgi:8-oxo-dGTP pyrophosphatase MutT (NUDIX family)